MSFLLLASSLAFALDPSDVRAPIGYAPPPNASPIWTGFRNKVPDDGEFVCQSGTIPAVIGTADQIIGGTEAQLALDWGRAWAVQPADWDGDWAYIIMTSTIGQSEKSAAIWCIEPQSLLQSVADAAPMAAYVPPPPVPTTCQLVNGPSLNWDGMEVGESATRSTTITWVCDGPKEGTTQVALSLPDDGNFDIEGASNRTLSPNKPEVVEVTYTAPDTEEREISLQATGPEGMVKVPGVAKARQPASSAYEPCKWGFGANVGANISPQGLVGTLTIDGFIPVSLSGGRCNSVHFFGGGGLTPGRDEVAYLDGWQEIGVATGTTYIVGGGYNWGEGVKTFELGGQLQALRIHWDGTPDAYQAGPRVAWTPRFGAFQLQVWASPGLMWGYAEGGSTGWSSAFGQTAMDSADRIQPTVAGGIGLGFRL